MPFTTGLATNGSKDTRGTQRLYIINIIRRVVNVKVKSTTRVDMELLARTDAFKPRGFATCSKNINASILTPAQADAIRIFEEVRHG